MAPPDPFESDDYAGEMERYLDARDAQRYGVDDGFDLDEHAQEWEARQAGQRAQELAAEQATVEEGYEQLRGMVDEATHGRLKGDPYQHEQFTAHVGLQLHEDAEAIASHLLNEGYPPEEIMPGARAVGARALSRRAAEGSRRDEHRGDEGSGARALRARPMRIRMNTQDGPLEYEATDVVLELRGVAGHDAEYPPRFTLEQLLSLEITGHPQPPPPPQPPRLIEKEFDLSAYGHAHDGTGRKVRVGPKRVFQATVADYSQPEPPPAAAKPKPKPRAVKK
jgi:hypothetical protein